MSRFFVRLFSDFQIHFVVHLYKLSCSLAQRFMSRKTAIGVQLTLASQVKHKNCEISDCTHCIVESFCNVNDILKIVGKNLINSHGIGEKLHASYKKMILAVICYLSITISFR